MLHRKSVAVEAIKLPSWIKLESERGTITGLMGDYLISADGELVICKADEVQKAYELLSFSTK